MTRLEPLSRDQASAEVHDLFDKDLATYGRIMNTTGIYAYCPTIHIGLKQMAAGVNASGLLPLRLRCFLNLVVAGKVGDPNCYDTHTYQAQGAGVSSAELAAVKTFRESSLFDEREKAALELADAATNTPSTVTDELFERVQAQFSKPELIELATTIVVENLRTRFNRIFDLGSNGLAGG
ncbi:MAG: carboxymuconolactone decarboxylase family protein [Chloroflexi bacterium]|nr:carboxymuconolactone decarboxylase family protein [Chloroflexota bacterium]